MSDINFPVSKFFWTNPGSAADIMQVNFASPEELIEKTSQVEQLPEFNRWFTQGDYYEVMDKKQRVKDDNQSS